MTVLFGGDASGTLLADTWLLSGDTWLPGPAAPAGLAPRAGHSMAYHEARGATVLYGGCSGQARITWELDAAGWHAGPASPQAMPAGCEDVMAYHPDRQVVFLRDSWGNFDALWEYDGMGWSLAFDHAPGTAGMAFDAASRKMVLLGASGQQLETWVLDGCSLALTRWPLTSVRASNPLVLADAGRPVILTWESLGGFYWGGPGIWELVP